MKHSLFLYSLLTVFALTSCDQIDEASSATFIEGKNVKFTMSIKGSDSASSGNEGYSFTGMEITLTNSTEGLLYHDEFEGSECVINNIVPGIYSIRVAGTAFDNEGTEIPVQVNLVRQSLLNDGTTSSASKEPTLFPVQLSASPKGALVFSEVYYCGATGFYFRDQFYEIANNSDSVKYLDGIYFSNSPAAASNHTPKTWPEEDGDKYIYMERVWRFPGSGTDYPLQPGESVVLAQWAVNHPLLNESSGSVVDCSVADFEFYMDSPLYPDQEDVVNMEHVWYNGSSAKGTTPQYLTSVFGVGLVIFEVPEGEEWDPINNPELSTTDLATTSATLYVKIPRSYVIDGVEAIRSESYDDMKYLPGEIDGGFYTLNGTYQGLSVARKRVGEGSPVKFVDTNNSTNDFEVGVVPVIRRYCSVPSWSHINK